MDRKMHTRPFHGRAASRLRAAMLIATPLALIATLAACGDQGAGGQVVVPAPLPSATATPTPTPTASATPTLSLIHI